MTSNFLALDLIRLPCKPKDLSEVACPGCQDHLEVHQPDERRPDRLLGTCESCRAWFLIDAVAAVMVRLPVADALAGRRSGGPVPPGTDHPVRSAASLARRP
jgi:uncharacterized protein YbaR (Trm112 family)